MGVEPEVSQNWVLRQHWVPQIRELGAWQVLTQVLSDFWHFWPEGQQLVPHTRFGAMQEAEEMQLPCEQSWVAGSQQRVGLAAEGQATVLGAVVQVPVLPQPGAVGPKLQEVPAGQQPGGMLVEQ
jgi:hypothetical protein